jgi:hypothetical protein
MLKWALSTVRQLITNRQPTTVKYLIPDQTSLKPSTTHGFAVSQSPYAPIPVAAQIELPHQGLSNHHSTTIHWFVVDHWPLWYFQPSLWAPDDNCPKEDRNPCLSATYSVRAVKCTCGVDHPFFIILHAKPCGGAILLFMVGELTSHRAKALWIEKRNSKGESIFGIVE